MDREKELKKKDTLKSRAVRNISLHTAHYTALYFGQAKPDVKYLNFCITCPRHLLNSLHLICIQVPDHPFLFYPVECRGLSPSPTVPDRA